ncbi:MAG TPA: class I SAM-dependent methyltransferase [Hydrogenophaga sp.]|uniref:class I SAM-dependent methyltransferase n=1 Tax=Hydrogenophaga sp. TaxID=1904254 RepID=UPI000E816FB1|nr:class I SAM-dependent methyltransferase [Hydrogenophaga sp.]HAX19787.1 class I SAM-dependent methyltransferase [Hydrogenophaga sp.]HBU20155.1 class I SAM-dependent methyltransferase [Hydrogenophaga sp.]
MQITSGIRAILSHSLVYDAFQSLMGASSIRQELVHTHIRPFAGMRILDIGCGTARILDHLPDVQYHGFDPSSAYIEDAKRRYPTRGQFDCALVQHATLQGLQAFDIVLAVGVLHHLDDTQALALLSLAKASLGPTGRFVSIDPVFAPDQHPLARYLVAHDRGQNVRDAAGYRALGQSVFPQLQAEVKHRRMIPYTHCIMECQK